MIGYPYPIELHLCGALEYAISEAEADELSFSLFG